MLDNARDAAHVRPFVKAPPGCAVLVTSRDRTQDYADPGLAFEVGRLARSASVEVLARCAEGVEPKDGDRLARLCADVPLALRIVGARLAQPSGPGAAYLVQLLEEESARLDALAYGDRAVRLAIGLSHDALDPAARRALRLTAAAPGSAVTGDELGHCLGEAALRQELVLTRLADHSLALQEVVRMATGRLLASFRLHELVRLFAAERLAEDEHPDFVRSFQESSVRYLSARLTEITELDRGAELSGELDPTRFHAALRLARKRGWQDRALELASSLHILYTSRGELDAIVAVNEVRVSLHLQSGDPEGAVRVCLVNSETLRGASGPRTGAAATEAARRAAGIAREYGVHGLLPEAELALSLALREQEEWAEALAAGERADAALRASDRVAATRIAVNNARVARRLEDPEVALRWGRSALERSDATGDVRLRAYARNVCGLAEEHAGRPAAALALYRGAADLWESLGDQDANAAVEHANAGYMAHDLADPATAVHLWLRAADLWERDGVVNRAVEMLVDVSALYAATDAYRQSADVLTRAARLARDDGGTSPLQRLEVHLRGEAARLCNGTRHPRRTEEDRAPEGTEPGNADLAELRSILEAHAEGRLTTSAARRRAAPLLNPFAHHCAHREEPWVFEDLGVEAEVKGELEG
ncbi:hypothetical protein [Streptomyces sp. NPDC050504]|uniref:hypothetical protein n=1 Tax=Streptomyces sp. NPDC050504 TaxID=3365618 RepID=UPI0037A24F8C